MIIDRNEFLRNQKEREARRAAAGDQPRANVSFMALGDGDEAIVRLAPLDWNEIIYFHNETDDWKSRKIACNRTDFKDPLDKCPFCAKKMPLKSRYYVKMIHYTRDENGEVVATEKVWDAPTRYVSVLVDREEEYGPVQDMIFKMKRTGSGQTTTYDFLPMMSKIYNDDVYKKNFGGLENFKALGTLVKELSVDEMKEILGEEIPAPEVRQAAPRKVTY